MAQLVIDQVHKIYEGAQGGVHALRGVSFQVNEGDFVALCGPSGCGKSTLLHIVGAMDQPTSGTVSLWGRAIEGLSRNDLARLRRREVGFVFQAYYLLPTLTVSENVALPLSLDGTPQRIALERARELLDYVGLSHRLQSLPAQLSGGEMQRAAVARAIVAKPRLIVADEPTGSLDSENGRRVMQVLADLNRDRKLTILLATHSLEAAAYARRVIQMRDGQIESIEEHAGIPSTI